MKLTKTLILLVFSIYLYSCKSTDLPKAETLGEENSSFSYIPLDPLPISTVMGNSCKPCDPGKPIPFKSLLNSFPDQTVRLSIAKIEADGSVSYGSAVKANASGETYEVTLDYINVDVTRIPFFYRKKQVNRPSSGDSSDGKSKDIKKTIYEVAPNVRFPQEHYGNSEGVMHSLNSKIKKQRDSIKNQLEVNGGNWEEKVVPVYIGVGLRVVARVTTLESGVNLSGLGVIASEAKAGRLKGSLSVQTLGITGKTVASSLPLPSEINETTIQNAILAIGTIKAQLYSNPTEAGSGNDANENKDIVITPRVVGIYKPFKGGQDVVNSIISELANDRVLWYRPCKKQPLYPTSCTSSSQN
ncbi:hypothetical protein [Tenacibaculum sp. 190524A05c]|uniref:Uncharacterized protein n=1 Tax=Tenacibaculum platacis TaxID=3137852 RepID=A0ABM9NY38_9FLAO